MTPLAIFLLILGTIKAVAELGVEALKFIQTEQGKQIVTKMIEDRETWDKNVTALGNWVKALVRGELFK